MDDAVPPTSELESREPSVEDLAGLCAALNAEGARYLVIGGFAVRAAGYDRRTMDVDLLVETTLENESKVLAAVSRLPDHAASELQAGEISQYVVIRVADEIVVDLMQSASGIDYASACREVTVHEVLGVPIPFAAPELLLRMKSGSVREKDRLDVAFLKRLLAAP